MKDAEKKTHPCLVPYDQLSDEQKRKDEIFLETVQVGLDGLKSGGLHQAAINMHALNWFDQGHYHRKSPLLLQIDVTSHAASVGHYAANRIFELLVFPDDEPPALVWYGAVDTDIERISDVALRLAEYIADRPAPILPETLFRVAAGSGFHGLPVGEFAAQHEAVKAAYAAFTNVVGGLIDWLEDEQGKLRDELAARAPQEPAVHNRADSALEQHGGWFDKHRLSGAGPDEQGKDAQ